MVCRCARCVQQLGPQGDRRVPAANCGAAGAPAPLSQNRSACRSREQTGIGSVCASALCCHPADLSLSTSLCTHGKNIGKLGTGKRRNAEYAEAFSMNVEVLWQKMRKRNMICTFQRSISLATKNVIYTSRRSIPDGERFAQASSWSIPLFHLKIGRSLTQFTTKSMTL